jgi:hypothetical protein
MEKGEGVGIGFVGEGKQPFKYYNNEGLFA